MTKGKALVAATVVAVAVVGWRFIESVLADGGDELDWERQGTEPTKTPPPAPKPKPAAPKAKPARPAAKAAKKGAAAPAGASKAELYEIATKLKIKGRSKMSKAELAKAIEKAS